MTQSYPFLSVVMCETPADPLVYPAVSAVFASREKADDYVAAQNSKHQGLRFYIDTSFHNVLED